MKTLTKTNKAIVLALVVALLFVATAFVLTACNGDKDPVTTKYDATLTADVTMGSMGTFSMGSVLAGAYVTSDNGTYTLTLTFKLGEIKVGTLEGKVFVDDSPADAATVNGLKDGTIGVYNKNGELVTDGVKVTYSSGEDYTVNNAMAKVYYVKSASFPVESLSEEYGIALFVNSAMKGSQFSKDVNPATVKLDLKSGEAVEEISGLGVETKGTVAGQQPDTSEDEDEDEEGEVGGGEETVAPTYTKYDASLSMYVSAMNMEFGGVLDSVYVTEVGEQSYLTLTFKSNLIQITMGPAPIPCNTFVDDGVSGAVIGYYDDEEALVTDGVVLTYSTGYDYVVNSAGENVYYVKSATFEIDALQEEYELAIYVNSDKRGFQFGESDYQATLTIDLENGEDVERISGLGVSAKAEVPEEEPAFIKYDAELSCYLSAMGGIEFGGVLDRVYLSKENGDLYITLIFKANSMTVMNVPATAFVDDTKGAGIGIYNEEELETENVQLTYGSENGFIFVQSAKFAIESIQEEFKFSLYINSDKGMGGDFSVEGKGAAVLTIDFSKVGEGVDSIDNLLGVATRAELETE